MSKLDQLSPAVRPLFSHFLSALDRAGLRYSVLETLRTQAVQDAYYAQGREPLAEVNRLRKLARLYPLSPLEAGRRITRTRHSVHQDGIAADIVPVLDNGAIPWDYGRYQDLWETFGRLGQAAGLEWGGTWSPLLPCGLGWDPPHYEKLETP